MQLQINAITKTNQINWHDILNLIVKNALVCV